MSGSLKDHLQVTLAALLGVGSPGLSGVLAVSEPYLQASLVVGQIGVAIVTILYIYRKWEQVEKTVRRPRKSVAKKVRRPRKFKK